MRNSLLESGSVLKTIRPGSPGSGRWRKQFGGRLVCVRYRGDSRRRVRSTTVEIVVDEKFWDPNGNQNYKQAMSNTGHSA